MDIVGVMDDDDDIEIVGVIEIVLVVELVIEIEDVGVIDGVTLGVEDIDADNDIDGL